MGPTYVTEFAGVRGIRNTKWPALDARVAIANYRLNGDKRQLAVAKDIAFNVGCDATGNVFDALPIPTPLILSDLHLTNSWFAGVTNVLHLELKAGLERMPCECEPQNNHVCDHHLTPATSSRLWRQARIVVGRHLLRFFSSCELATVPIGKHGNSDCWICIVDAQSDPDDIAMGYQFEMVHGAMDDAMKLLMSADTNRPQWLENIAASDDGWMIDFGWSPMEVGSIVDLRTGKLLNGISSDCDL